MRQAIQVKEKENILKKKELTCTPPRLIPLYLTILNKRHAKRRQELGKSVALVDESMITKEKMEEDSKAVELENAGAPQHKHRALEEDNALHDVTDLNNEDFIYVY